MAPSDEDYRDRADEAETIDRLRGIWRDREDQVRWHLYSRVKNRVAFDSSSEDTGHSAALAAVYEAGVASERERAARIAGAETDFTDAIAAEAARRHPHDHTVDDPFGATGEARTDPYGYEEYARTAFIAGALFQHEQERTRRLTDAAAIREGE